MKRPRKVSVEACLALRVMDLRREGFVMLPGRHDSLGPRMPLPRHWRDPDDESLGAVEITGGSEAIVLRYRIGTGMGPLIERKDTIPIVWTPCRLGGVRPWFVCMGAAFGCGRSVDALYAKDLRLACRRCHDLTYRVQRQSKADRLTNPLDKILIRLRAGPGQPTFSYPKRPKGMHRITYERLCGKLEQAQAKVERKAYEHVSRRLERLYSRYL